jgi:hypothetical protein
VYADRTVATSSPSTASFETFNKIHYWLWECNNHLECMEVRLQRRHQISPPTRLIYVGSYHIDSRSWFHEGRCTDETWRGKTSPLLILILWSTRLTK